jgi:hypothetical protein
MFRSNLVRSFSNPCFQTAEIFNTVLIRRTLVSGSKPESTRNTTASKERSTAEGMQNSLQSHGCELKYCLKYPYFVPFVLTLFICIVLQRCEVKDKNRIFGENQWT